MKLTKNAYASPGGRFLRTPHLEAKKGFLMVWNTDEKNGVSLRGADCKL